MTEDQLASLIHALHHVSQSQLPIAMVAAGLPQILGNAGRAKSYAERLFEFVSIDRLDETAARAALIVPATKEGVTSRMPLSPRSSGRPAAIPISFRSGESIAGISLTPRRSQPTMPGTPRSRRLPNWMPASSASASTDSHPQRSAICGPWRNWALVPIAPAMWPSFSTARSRPLPRCEIP